MRPLLLGIDVGTSNIKICIFDYNGNLIKQTSDSTYILQPSLGQVELDMDIMLSTVKRLLKECISGYEPYIESIGISVTSPTLVLLDKNLNPIRPGILYLDNRSSEEVSLYARKLGGKEGFFSKIGNNPSPSTCTLGLLNWIKKEEPKSWDKVYKIGYLNTYLASYLTGEVGVDPTIASLSGLVDISNPAEWNDDLVRISGINPDILPDIKPSYNKIGPIKNDISEEFGLKKGIAVALGSADTAAASLALGLKQNGEVFENMGTSGILTFCLTNPSFNNAFMNRSHVIPGLWLAHGAMSTTGAAITWAKNDLFPEVKTLNDLETLALQSGAGSDGVIFLPYLSGERSPIFNPNACGIFYGLSLQTDRSSIIRSIYEGAAYGIRQLYEIARKSWNFNVNFIRCVGGASRSSLALQIRADILKKPYRSILGDDASVFGAALMGGLAAEIYTNIKDIPSLDTFLMSVYPNENNTNIYDDQFNIYESLYPSLKHLMK